MEKAITKTHRIFKDERGIIHVEIIDGVHIDLDCMIETGALIHSITGCKKELVMIDARTHHTITDEAMSYINNEMINKNRIATAVVTNKLGIKIMVDYFIKVLKTKADVKVCTCEEEAVSWLLEIMNGKSTKAIDR